MTRTHSRLLTQVTLLGLLAVFIYFIAETTSKNLARVGISTGFDFLGEPSGFEIAFLLIDYSSDSVHFDVFLVGIVNTLLVSTLAILFCTVIGFLIGILQLSSNKLTAIAARTYVEAFRNIPLLLNIFFWYFITINIFPDVANSIELGDFGFLNQRGLYLPKISISGYEIIILAGLIGCSAFGAAFLARKHKNRTGGKPPYFCFLLGIAFVLIAVSVLSGLVSTQVDFPEMTRFNVNGGMEIIPELFALVIGLSIYHGAFVAEYVRGGILAVSKGQSEAALSTGLSDWQVMRLVIIPQALRVIIPPYISNNLNVVKNSSLGAAIAFPELISVFAGTSLNLTGNAVEIILMVMGFYFTVSIIISLILNAYNKHVQLVER